MKITILGTGRVAQALAQGFTNNGHEVTLGSRDPSKGIPIPKVKVTSQKEAVQQAEIVVFAVPHSAVGEIVSGVGKESFSGKTVVDATNVMTPSLDWATGPTTSGAEELSKLLPGAHVVKAFNTVFAKSMSTGKVKGESLTLFVAGDDAQAKESVMRLAGEIGFDPVDAGLLRAARYLEPMALLNINLGFNQKMGTEIGFKLVR